MPDFVSVEEYLTHSYDPECEYVDGAFVERLGFELTHRRFKTLLRHHLHALADLRAFAFRLCQA